MEKILSVSVASYNLGDMIQTNVESFCKSNVADKIELIITDDGSKDNTPEIIEKLAKQYPNTIKFIKKANEGPGSTVNSGIKHATGKYFRMVDGDDWVNTSNLESYISVLEKSEADMIVSDYQIFDNKKQLIIETVRYDLPVDTIINFDDCWNQVSNAMHAIAFRTKILQTNQIRVDNGFYTDNEYVFYPIPYVKTVSYFNKPIYIYRIAQAGQSVSVTSLKKNTEQQNFVVTNLLNWFVLCKKQLSLGQRKYLIKGLAIMADYRLGTLLLFEVNRENKAKIKAFVKLIKNTDAEIYAMFRRGKKAHVLIYSNYILYSWVAKKYQKMNENT